MHHNREPWIIRRDLTSNNVPAHDRRAVFVGAEAYAEAGGNIIRDLFTDDDDGYFEDAKLLDMLVIEKLREIAGEVQAEGWKWAEAHIDYPHAHGLRRYYPLPTELSHEDEARLEAASAQYDSLIEGYDSFDAMPEDVAAKVETLDREIDTLTAKRSAFEPDLIARGGIFVTLSHDGAPRIERGFVRPEDEPVAVEAPTDDKGPREADESLSEGAEAVSEDGGADESALDSGKSISDSLMRDLTAHRTLALRLALGDNMEIALVAITHALAAQTFYHYAEAACLEIRPTTSPLGQHAEGIEDSEVAAKLSERHEQWAAQLPRDVADLWTFVAALDQASRAQLLGHCASLTVNALRLPWDRKPRALATADKLATALSLDMTVYWTPTLSSYLGRVTKAHVLEAVREGVSDEAAERIAGMKKPDMAAAAELLLAGSGWLPALLRSAEQEICGAQLQNGTVEAETEYAVAAE